MEKTYFEFKITFLHIVVFLVAVIAIGIFLFYMGYQAGQRRADPRTIIANEQGQDDGADLEKLDVVDERPVHTARGKIASPGKERAPQSIPEEIKLHEAQVTKEPTVTEKKAAVEPAYTIQVGAFADFANAQRCSQRFTSLGYPAAIITDNQKNLHTVQIGNYASLAEAQKDKTKLERQEKAKFQIKKAR